MAVGLAPTQKEKQRHGDQHERLSLRGSLSLLAALPLDRLLRGGFDAGPDGGLKLVDQVGQLPLAVRRVFGILTLMYC